MPGVPSGRGCDACRRQKKKCDQGKPACSRCSRLQIECVGSGQRRFKFKEQNVGSIAPSAAGQSSRTNRDRAVARRSQSAGSSPEVVLEFVTFPQPLPSNDLSRVRAGLIHALEARDLRYDLRAFGLFLTEVPKRLGDNKALMAAAKALTAAHEDLSVQPTTGVVSLSEYVNALRELRESLLDPQMAFQIDTLVAIYIIMISQGVTGYLDNATLNHGPILAYLLDVLTSRDKIDEFEAQVMCAASVAVIGYGVLTPSLRVNPSLWRLTNPHKLPATLDCDKGVLTEVLSLPAFAKTGEYLNNPESNYSEIKARYNSVLKEYKVLRGSIERLEKAHAESKPDATERRELSRRYACYGMMLSLGCVFNSVMTSFHPENENLPREAEEFVDNMLAHGQKALAHRPLGAGYMAFTLASALTCDLPASQREQVLSLLSQFDSDYSAEHWCKIADWMKRKHSRLRAKVEISGVEAVADSPPSVAAEQPIEVPEDEPPPGSCTVM